MSELGSTQPIIIKRKVAGHGGHHGGAWKVAYADFVTAMMALFIVLWLLNTDQKIQKAVGGYFRDPSGKGILEGTSVSGTGEGGSKNLDDMAGLREQIERAMRKVPELERIRDHISMTVTNEGLRIELLESEKGIFFDVGQPRPSSSGEDVLTLLAKEIGALPNRILIEGHTDSRPFSGGGSYGNWELSADRANAARRILLGHGMRPDQVGQIRGFADQRLRRPDAPEDASNRRISVLVQYSKPLKEAESKPSAETKGGETVSKPAPARSK